MSQRAPLISPDELAAALVVRDRPVVLDVRWHLGEGANRAAYDAGHIPGAVFIDFDREICGEPGIAGRHPLPDPEVLQAALRRAGVDDGRSVVVVDDGDLLPAARTWWTLRWAGVENVRVLDGGMSRWSGPADSVVPTPREGDVSVRPGRMAVLEADAAARLAGSGTLLDVRAPERYRGDSEPIDRVAGHVPGAVNVAGSLVVDGRMVSPERVSEMLSVGGAPVGAYCGSGVAAARMVLAGATAGIDIGLYVGSWSEWITDPQRPIASGRDAGEAAGDAGSRPGRGTVG